MHVLPTLLSLIAVPQPSGPVTWSTASSTGADGLIQVELIAHCEQGWHFYATQLPSDQGPLPTIFRFEESTNYMPVGPLVEPPAVEEFDENFGVQVFHHSGEPRFSLVIKPAVKEAFVVSGEVEFMACNGRTCLPPVAVPFSVTIDPAEPK